MAQRNFYMFKDYFRKENQVQLPSLLGRNFKVGIAHLFGLSFSIHDFLFSCSLESYVHTMWNYVLQHGTFKDSCYMCTGSWENTSRSNSQRSVLNLDEGTCSKISVLLCFLHFMTKQHLRVECKNRLNWVVNMWGVLNYHGGWKLVINIFTMLDARVSPSPCMCVLMYVLRFFYPCYSWSLIEYSLHQVYQG